MNEVSTLVTNIVAALSDADEGWPDWDITAYDARKVDEDETKHLQLVVQALPNGGFSSFPMTYTDERQRGVESAVITVVIQIDVYWRFIDDTTHKEDHPMDIASTLLAWSRNRWVQGATDVFRPLTVDMLPPDATNYQDADTTRLHYYVQFEADVLVTPQIELHGPDEVPLGSGPELTAPPFELHIDGEQRYPDE